MVYKNTLPGEFIERPNRFIALVAVDGQIVTCHVKNTGRCKELLIPRAKVFIQKAENPNRKTLYDLIAVYKGDVLVNIDSTAPNAVFRDWVMKNSPWGEVLSIRPETKWGNSRFDFYIETDQLKAFVEVKGVTLEEMGVALFPDAPTQRGIKHLEELVACKKEGYHAVVVFVIQMKGTHVFRPNDKTHPAFGRALREASAKGVEILAMDCCVSSDSMWLDASVPVVLSQ